MKTVTLPTTIKTGRLHLNSAAIHNGKRVDAGTVIEVADGDTIQFIDLKPGQEVVSVWDPRTWIAPEKSINVMPVTIFERTDEEMARDTKPLKRIDKIAKY